MKVGAPNRFGGSCAIVCSPLKNSEQADINQSMPFEGIEQEWVYAAEYLGSRAILPSLPAAIADLESYFERAGLQLPRRVEIRRLVDEEIYPLIQNEAWLNRSVLGRVLQVFRTDLGDPPGEEEQEFLFSAGPAMALSVSLSHGMSAKWGIVVSAVLGLLAGFRLIKSTRFLSICRRFA